MTEDYELLLQDRIGVIRDTINKFGGEGRFYISFSGGRDSTVLHYLVDLALPGNTIPRVFSNTGIEFNAIVEHVRELSATDNRFITIYPKKNIKKTLEEVGYPFKSKEHSKMVSLWHSGGKEASSVKEYINNDLYSCPDILRYQFSDEFKINVSDACCNEFKKKPFHQYEKDSKRRIGITGIRKAEGGQRKNSNCLSYRNGRIKRFNPLVIVDDDWIEWFINKYNIKLCKLYYPPYNFKRTGCKGCPYNINLRRELNILHNYFPGEERQCEYIWKPIYEEYRRLGYRLWQKKGRRLF
jgi:3'-phosphoadenosine 5'-phosphosulfate sulfotransferase (PAPS reductase)/FAD synthetase